MRVVIQSSTQVWRSPDGQRTMYSVTYTDPQTGQLVNAKTFSGALANGLNQQFDVETYTKPDKQNKLEIFVKQVQTQNFGGSQYNTQLPAQSAPNGSGAPTQRSNYVDNQADTRASIERQTALKAAVDAVHGYYNTVGAELKQISLEQYANDIVKYAKVLNVSASGVPANVAETFPGAEDTTNIPEYYETQGSLV